MEQLQQRLLMKLSLDTVWRKILVPAAPEHVDPRIDISHTNSNLGSEDESIIVWTSSTDSSITTPVYYATTLSCSVNRVSVAVQIAADQRHLLIHTFAP